MDSVKVLLNGVGAVLIVLGAISRLRGDKKTWRLWLPGSILFLLGCLVLAA